MIRREPRLIDRDGNRVLVDETGHELVCRRTHGCYHRIDLDRYERTGDIKPQCEHVTGHEDNKWTLKRRANITEAWHGCQYESCYGTDETTATGETGQHLRTVLSEMSVKEFETAVAEAQADGRERA